MPHTVIRGDLVIQHWSHKFSPLIEKSTNWLIKINEVYVGSLYPQALFHTVVVEEGHSQTFYICLSGDNQKQRFSIRLDSLTDPIKTKGVKRSIALLAETLLCSIPNAQIERHNLQDYLKAEYLR